MSNDELVDFAEGLARVASTGGGPKALAAHLATLLDAAVLVEDAEWRHVALAGAAKRSVPPSSRDLISAAPKDGDGAVTLQTPGDATPGPRGAHSRRRFADRLALGISERDAADGRVGAVRLAAAAIAVELSRDAGGGRNAPQIVLGSFDLARLRRSDRSEGRRDARGITLAAVRRRRDRSGGPRRGVATAKMGDLRRICLETLRSGAGDIVVLERGGGFVFLCPAPMEVDAANARTAATLIARAAARDALRREDRRRRRPAGRSDRRSPHGRGSARIDVHRAPALRRLARDAVRRSRRLPAAAPRRRHVEELEERSPTASSRRCARTTRSIRPN
jgi:hypothetical protein